MDRIDRTQCGLVMAGKYVDKVLYTKNSTVAIAINGDELLYLSNDVINSITIKNTFDYTDDAAIAAAGIEGGIWLGATGAIAASSSAKAKNTVKVYDLEINWSNGGMSLVRVSQNTYDMIMRTFYSGQTQSQMKAIEGARIVHRDPTNFEKTMDTASTVAHGTAEVGKGCLALGECIGMIIILVACVGACVNM